MSSKSSAKISVVVTLLHALISSISSYATFPVERIAGLEGISILVALIAASIGSVLGFIKHGFEKLAMAIIGVLIVPALLCYGQILSRGGVLVLTLWLGVFLYFYIYFALFYVLTILERLVLKRFFH